MKIFKNKKILISEISMQKNIAFVPTMGSIHKGHISLINRAKKKFKTILVSIYVNPKQFNSKTDFKSYPRNLNKDIALLRKLRINYLYIPEYNDIYSFNTKSKIYLDKFSKTLCGKYKPGHFKGVINVVNRLLEIIKPHTIFLGIKDYQQLTLIKMHISKNKIETSVMACPTIRESNGVALSSRNIRLNKHQFGIASNVYKYLKKNKKEIFSINLKYGKKKFKNKINLLGVKKIDYLECINLKTSRVAKNNKENYNIFIAYYIGKIRMIDNL